MRVCLGGGFRPWWPLIQLMTQNDCPNALSAAAIFQWIGRDTAGRSKRIEEDRRGSKGGRQSPTETRKIFVQINKYIFIYLYRLFVCICTYINRNRRRIEKRRRRRRRRRRRGRRGRGRGGRREKRGKTNDRNRSTADVI